MTHPNRKISNSLKANGNNKSLHFVQALSEPLILKAAEGDDDSGPKTFSMIAYTGGRMNVGFWPHPVVVDIKGIKFSRKPRPILRDHDTSRIVGHTTAIKKEASKLTVDGIISAGNSEAEEIINSSAQGFPWQASIGADIGQMLFVKEGESANANGQSFDGPVYIARRSTLGEVSFVALGADDNTTVKVAAESAELETEIVHMDFEKWLEAKGFKLADLSAGQVKSMKASYEAEMTATKDKEDADKLEADAKAKKLEAEKPEKDAGVVDTESLKAQARKALAEVAEETASIEAACKGHADIKAKALKEGWDVTKCELEVLRATRSEAPAIISSGKDVTAKSLEAAAMMASGVKGNDLLKEKRYDEETIDAADKRFQGRIGLQEVILQAAWATGYLGDSFRRDMRGVMQAAFSTASLPGILSNIANKFLLDGFNSVEDSWRQISGLKNVKDFKTATSYRLTGGFEYEQVGPDGELKNATIGEDTFTNKADTYGKIFSLTRQMLINDDLGALTDVTTKIGRGAALKFNKVFWTAFLNNAAFFTAGRDNFLEGAASNLQISSLTTAETAFFDQTDPDGDPVGIAPGVLLVPNALNVIGSNLFRSTEVRPGSDSTLLTQNPHAGKFPIVRSSYLSSQGIAGGSATAWYLLATPADMPVIESAFLNGVQEPTVESADANFNTLGIQMRGFHDFGVSLQEYRGGVKTTGVA